jgi:hypothetical protein
MKKISLIVLSLVVLMSTAFSMTPTSIAPKLMKASEVFFTIGKDGKKISLLDLSKMSKDDLEKAAGRKMNFPESLAFKGAQKKLKKEINADGYVTNKKMQKMFSSDGEGFHLGGFALGFLLGLIGVLIAYLLNDEKKQNRRKWAWIGLGVAVVITVILVAAVL